MNGEQRSAGSVVSIQLCPGHRKAMQRVASVRVIENLGLENDRHALPDSSRQVLLIEKETLDNLGLNPGQVKENITTAGLSLMTLVPKQRLRIGPDVVLEVAKACSPCSRMEEIRPGLLGEITGKRGMLARVKRGGLISVGDEISLLEG